MTSFVDLLAKIYDDLLYGRQWKEISLSDAFSSPKKLQYLLSHPQMHRIVIKLCAITRTEYSALRQTGRTSISILQFADFCRGFDRYAFFIWRSMRYWNKYQMLYFINYLTDDVFHGIWCKSLTKDGVCNDLWEGTCLLPEYWCSLYLCKKIKMFKEQWIDVRPRAMIEHWDFLQIRLYTMTEPFHRERQRAIAEIKVHRMRERKRLIQNVVCASKECEMKGARQKLKVCENCKMVYYCSRRCQKRAWAESHRLQCHKLVECFGL